MVHVRFTYRNHNFLTQITDTFMDFAICASVMPPFLFFLTIQFTFDSSSFLVTQIRCCPICLYRSARCSNLRTFIPTLHPKSVMMCPSHGTWCGYTTFWTMDFNNLHINT